MVGEKKRSALSCSFNFYSVTLPSSLFLLLQGKSCLAQIHPPLPALEDIHKDSPSRLMDKIPKKKVINFSWFYYLNLLELETDFHVKGSVPGPKHGCLGPIHALKYPRYLHGAGRYDTCICAEWRGWGKQSEMGLALCSGASAIVQNNSTLLGALSCSRLPNSAWLVSRKSQECVHVSFVLLLPGGAIKAQRTWTATKRTPLSESSECSGFPNTVSHPTNKLCESFPDHFSAHILSKRTKDDSDIASNEIKRLQIVQIDT